MDHNAAPLADRVVQTAYFAVTGRALSRSLLPFETVAAPTIVAATSWTAIDHA